MNQDFLLLMVWRLLQFVISGCVVLSLVWWLISASCHTCRRRIPPELKQGQFCCPWCGGPAAKRSTDFSALLTTEQLTDRVKLREITPARPALRLSVGMFWFVFRLGLVLAVFVGVMGVEEDGLESLTSAFLFILPNFCVVGIFWATLWGLIFVFCVRRCVVVKDDTVVSAGARLQTSKLSDCQWRRGELRETLLGYEFVPALREPQMFLRLPPCSGTDRTQKMNEIPIGFTIETREAWESVIEEYGIEELKCKC